MVLRTNGSDAPEDFARHLELILSEAWPYVAGEWAAGGKAPYAPQRAAEYAAFVTNYATKLKELAQQNPGKTFYLDVWNEPNLCDAGVCFFAGTREQFFETFKGAYLGTKAVLAGVPNVKIGGPSLSGFQWDGYLKPFLDYAQANGLALDFVSWHELAPDSHVRVRGNVATVQGYLQGKPALSNASVHINEFAGPLAQYDLQTNMVFLSELEAAGVDAASKACWPEGANVNVWSGLSNCFNGALDGLLTPGLAPRPLWELFRIYGSLGTQRAQVSGNDPGLRAFATPRNVDGCVQYLGGRWGGNTSSLSLNFRSIGGFVNGAATLKVEALTANGLAVVQSSEVQVGGSDFSLSVPCSHGQICNVTLCPKGGAASYVPIMQNTIF